MRTTLEIDDGVLESARTIAKKKGHTLGDVISELARRSLYTEGEPVYRNGIRVIVTPPGTPKMTMEEVNRLRDEE